MTAPGGKRPSMMETVQTTDGFLRHAGRDFLIVLYTAFRSLKLYPIENAQVQKALDDLAGTTKQDRKSTRLNSSHGYISYAVFCLKKKKNKHTPIVYPIT